MSLISIAFFNTSIIINRKAYRDEILRKRFKKVRLKKGNIEMKD